MGDKIDNDDFNYDDFCEMTNVLHEIIQEKNPGNILLLMDDEEFDFDMLIEIDKPFVLADYFEECKWWSCLELYLKSIVRLLQKGELCDLAQKRIDNMTKN